MYFRCVEIFMVCCTLMLGSGGDILPWLFLITFLHWSLGIWIWSDCSSRCWFMYLSSLVGCFLSSLTLARIIYDWVEGLSSSWGLDFWWPGCPLLQQKFDSPSWRWSSCDMLSVWSSWESSVFADVGPHSCVIVDFYQVFRVLAWSLCFRLFVLPLVE